MHGSAEVLSLETGPDSDIETMFERDFVQSEEQPAHVCRQRGPLFRIAVKTCRLMAPVL